jgi:hypothetical protein
MGEMLDKIPEKVRDHVRSIAAGSGLPEGEEAVEAIAGAWLEKKEIFEKQVAESGMEEVDELPFDSENGALVMTYSGSLLTIGPLEDDVRHVEYRSIGLRQDVPETAERDESKLSEDVVVDEVASFDPGPIKQSSQIYKIAVPKEELSPEEESDLLTSVTQVITQEFIDVNKTVAAE